MKIKDKIIKTASYNPRTMSKDAKDALLKSMEEFEDISGIVINENTGNIVSGNHRWDTLMKKYNSNLELIPITNNHSSINANSKPTGFIVKIVNWTIEKEKAANITANNDLLSGTFTAGLQDVLSEISNSFDTELFEELKLDELQIDLDGIDESLDWDDSQLSNVQESADRANNELKEAKGEEVTNLLEIIKVSVPSDIKQEVKDDLLEFLATKLYYNEISIV